MRIRGIWLLAFVGMFSFACSTDQTAEPSLETDEVAGSAETASPDPDDAAPVVTAAEIEALQLAVAAAQEAVDLATNAANESAEAARDARRESESLRAGVNEGAAAASDALQEASAAARIANDQRTTRARTQAAGVAQLAVEAADELNVWRQDLLESNEAELAASLSENDALKDLRDAELALELAEDALAEGRASEDRAEDPLVAPADWPTWMTEPESAITMVSVDLPRVPVIAPPDLSPPTERSSEIETELAALLTPSSGIDVLTAQCVADGGPLQYATGEAATDLLDAAQRGSSVANIIGGGRDFVVDVDANGAGSFVDFTGSTFVQASRTADGSGAYQDFTGDRFIRYYGDGDGFGTLIDRSGDNNFVVSLHPDGSGSLEDLGGSTFVVVHVRSDGSGTYSDFTGSLSFEFAVNADGSWLFHDLSGRRSKELIVNADGTGRYEVLRDGGLTTIQLGNDGAARYRNQADERDVEVSLFTNGSWALSDESDEWDRTLAVAADGSGWFDNDGASGRLSAEDTGSLSALVAPLLSAAEASTLLHPDLVAATPMREFAKADSFPPIGTFPNLARPCATVLRFDSEVLFDVEGDDLLPAAEPILDEIAAALDGIDQAIEVHGHTNADGSEEANLDLSERRAQRIAQGLIERGVTTETAAVGFGESQPAVPNDVDGGRSTTAGERLNSRVEVVLFGAG